jgi:hypothetical protein
MSDKWSWYYPLAQVDSWSLSRISQFGYLRGHATEKELNLEVGMHALPARIYPYAYKFSHSFPSLLQFVNSDTKKVEDSFRIIKTQGSSWKIVVTERRDGAPSPAAKYILQLIYKKKNVDVFCGNISQLLITWWASMEYKSILIISFNFRKCLGELHPLLFSSRNNKLLSSYNRKWKFSNGWIHMPFSLDISLRLPNFQDL